MWCLKYPGLLKCVKKMVVNSMNILSYTVYYKSLLCIQECTAKLRPLSVHQTAMCETQITIYVKVIFYDSGFYNACIISFCYLLYDKGRT